MMMHGFRFYPGRKDDKEVTGSPESSVSRGRKIFTTYCKRCHGDQGRGDGPVAQFLQRKPANLAARSSLTTGGEFFMMISGGAGKDMPAWKEVLSAREIRDLSAYLKTLKE